MKHEYARQIFETYYNVKFHENPTGESRGPCGRTEERTDLRKTDMKLIVAFRNFANAPKKRRIIVKSPVRTAK
jgi:hypothetical protein